MRWNFYIHTSKICSCAECSSTASYYAYPQFLILIELLPYLCDRSAGWVVNAIQLAGSVERDLYNMFRRKSDEEVVVFLPHS